jgi:molecular chaperone GrpE
VTRPTPDQGAVREQLRVRDEAGDRETTTDGAGAAADAAASEAAAEEATGQAPEEPTSEEADPQGTEEPDLQGAEAAAEPQEEPPEEELDPLARAQAERDQYLELAQRAQADFENYRKRTAQQVAQAGERAKVGLLRELLPVVDNLERALASAAEDEGPLAEGVKLVLAELQGVLAREGVEAIEPVGEPFDPNVHEALSTRPQDGAEAGLVLEVVEKGYRSRNSVIRPARVVVSA